MSSPITFSGFNNIDFGTVLNALMAQASQPLTALQSEQSALQAQSKTYDSLASQITTLSTAAAALNDASSLTTLAATSTDSSAVTASAGATAVAGHYDVVVQELARAQVTASATTAPDANSTIVASGGTVTIGTVTVNLTGPVTLQGLADAINQTQGIGVTASVVRASASQYRLVLTGHTTGAAGAFAVQSNLTGGTVSFGAPAVAATDASLLVNNVQVTSASNTITGAIPGVTLTATKKDPNTVIGVDVSADTTDLTSRVNAFITAYNSLVSFANDQTKAAASGDTSSIGHDSMLRALRAQLRSVINSTFGSGSATTLAQAGIEFTQTGTLQLNQTVFSNAISTTPGDVTALFAGPTGAFTAIQNTLDQYSQAGGYIATIKSSLTQQSSGLDSQIAAMQARLAVQKTALQQEFTAADAAISALQSQTTSLTSLNNSLTSASLIPSAG